MNLTLTRRGDYVVRAALCLASAWGERPYSKIREVARQMDLPVSYTPQVLGMLAKAGLAQAKAGRDGGYRLTRPPAEISMLEVVEAAEGSTTFRRCILRGGPCHADHACAVHPAWAAATEAFRASLASATLAAVAETDRDLHRESAAPAAASAGRRQRGSGR